MAHNAVNRAELLFYAAILGALWWVFTEGALHSWSVGVPAVLVAAWLAARLSRGDSPRLRPHRLPAFLGHFLLRSLLAGVDVARRTLHPQLPLQPGFVMYPLRIANPRGRLFFTAIVSLLPGTLATELRSQGVLLHVLDTRVDIATDTLATERQVARLFGETIPETPSPVTVEQEDL